jgi:hypothetical protein
MGEHEREESLLLALWKRVGDEEFIDQDLEQDAENEEETEIAESKGESGWWFRKEPARDYYFL